MVGDTLVLTSKERPCMVVSLLPSSQYSPPSFYFSTGKVVCVFVHCELHMTPHCIFLLSGPTTPSCMCDYRIYMQHATLVFLVLAGKKRSGESHVTNGGTPLPVPNWWELWEPMWIRALACEVLGPTLWDQAPMVPGFFPTLTTHLPFQ